MAFVQVPPQSTGEKISVQQVSDGVNTLDRQEIIVADDTTFAARAKVNNADPGTTDYGLTVRDVRGNATLPVRVDPTGTTAQPVSGTVTANAGTGTFTNQQSNVTADYDTGAGVQNVTMFGVALPASGGAVAGGTATNPLQVSLANTAANATAVKTDGSAVTQPVSAVSLPLPTGAATAAKQPALGTAGTPSADVLTVQGAASMTALKVDGSAVTQPVSGTITANIGTSGSLALDASVTGLQVAQASTTSGQKGALVQGAVTTNAPTYTTAQTDPLSLDTLGNLRVSLKDTPTNTNNLNVAVQSVPSNQSVNVAQVAGGTAATAAAGILKVGLTDGSGNAINSQSNALLVDQTPTTTNGLTIGPGSGAKLISAATTNATSVKASQGNVYSWAIYNTTASTLRYVKLYNKASAPTVGTDVPVITILVPPSGGTNFSDANGIQFGTGIALAITGAAGDTDTTAVAAGDIIVNLFFK